MLVYHLDVPRSIREEKEWVYKDVHQLLIIEQGDFYEYIPSS